MDSNIIDSVMDSSSAKELFLLFFVSSYALDTFNNIIASNSIYNADLKRIYKTICTENVRAERTSREQNMLLGMFIFAIIVPYLNSKKLGQMEILERLYASKIKREEFYFLLCLLDEFGYINVYNKHAEVLRYNLNRKGLDFLNFCFKSILGDMQSINSILS